MATIRNSITLQDRMSPVFRSIIRSMNSTLQVMQKVDRQANSGTQSKAYQKAQRDIQQANNALIKMTNNIDRANTSANKLSGSTSRINSSMSQLSYKGFNLTNLASALYILKNIENTMSSIMETPDTTRAIAYRLETYDKTNTSGEALLKNVYDAAIASRSDFTSTGQLAARILITGATGYNAPRSTALAQTMNKASFIGGSSAGESQRALLQLSQSLASGYLQGDELRAMREQAPGLMDTLAKGLSKLAEQGKLSSKFLNVTIGDLKKLGSEEELTASRVIAAYEAMADEVNATFENSPKLFSQAVTQAQSVWSMFVQLLSKGQGAFKKINDAAWEFANWLTSEQGWDTLDDLATILGVIADSAIWTATKVGEGLEWMHDHAEITKAVIFSLATAFTVMGIIAAASWTAMHWPALLFIAILSTVIFLLQKMGYTTSDILQGMLGMLYVLAAVSNNTVIFVVEGFRTIGEVALNVLLAILLGIGTAVSAAVAVIETVIILIVSKFQTMADDVLGIIWLIAKGIDTVFGSNLASSVTGWIDSLDSKLKSVYDYFNPKNLPLFQSDTWKNAPWANLDSSWMDDYGLSIMDIGEAYNSGASVGKGITDSFSSYDLYGQLNNLSSVLSSYDGTTTVDGGNLDSVGSIGSEVDISDEDLQLLRDIAAKEFLIQMASLTPKVEVTFGDVHETADVGAIMGVIETMAEEALATSLVQPD